MVLPQLPAGFGGSESTVNLRLNSSPALIKASASSREVINSDAPHYGGSGLGNGGVVIADQPGRDGQPASAYVTLPPLATLILELE